MQAKRYKPLFDKLYYIIFVPLMLILAVATTLATVESLALIIMLFVDVFSLYFVISPIFGYVELRETSLFIKYGFILKNEIPYANIRSVVKGRGVYSESMMSLKNSMEHVTLKYNRFDVTTVSVKGNDELIREISARMHA